ncbi:EAL domain-containing protein [Chitinimonas arctica]|nr:EAL domain-containing protein [Chitinimonas arctica]
MATILIVDDRAINRQFLGSLLGYGGHVIVEAADGIEALEVADKQPLDLVISDVLMPNMDGVELAKQLHAHPLLSNVPILFYTATYRVNDARDLASTCGVVGVLPKPSEPQVIVDTVTKILRGSRHAGTRSFPHADQPEEAGPFDPNAEQLASALLRTGDLQMHLRQALEQGLVQVGEVPKGGGWLSAFNDVQDISLRLSALLEVGLELSTEHEPQDLIKLCCRAAQDILSARFAAIGIIEDDKLVLSATRGLPAEASAEMRHMDPCSGVLGAALSTSKLCRVYDWDGTVVELGLPPAHPPITHMLVVPLSTASRTLGWIYFGDKLNGARFNDSDEQLATTLAVQLTQAYKNLSMLEQVRWNAAQLQAEVDVRKAALAALAQSEQRFRQIAENLKEVLFLIDPEEANNFYVSPAYETIWQQSCQTLRERPLAWMDIIHEDDLEAIKQSNARRQITGLIDIEYRIVRPDGSMRWIATHGFPIFDGAGKLHRIAGIAEDISERKQYEQRIIRLSRIQSVLSGINAAIIRIHDRQALFEESCRIAVEYGGFQMSWIGTMDPVSRHMIPHASAGMSEEIFDMLCQFTRSKTIDSLTLYNQALRSGEAVLLNHLADATDNPVHQAAWLAGCRSVVKLPIRPGRADSGVLAMLSTESDFYDVEEQRLLNEMAGDISFGLECIEKEERLSYLAYFDPLTDLPHSALFQDRLNQMLQGFNPNDGHVAVIVFDLDHFTYINDTFGRHVGDAVLKHVADCLSIILPESQLISRIGADTFAVALSCRQAGEEAGLLARSLLPALATPVLLLGQEINLTAHTGIALYPGDGDSAADLFKNAEAALMRARESSVEYLYYRPEINASVARSMVMERELRAAVTQQQFLVYYQPKLDLNTGRIIAAEALVRWSHPERGLVSPATFIPLAEETGLIVQIGEWVLRTVCAQQALWQSLHIPIVPVAVNLSALQCQRGDIQEVIRQTLTENKLEAKYLTLELTESAVIQDPTETVRLMTGLRKLGLHIALDDFGTGYSSLAYLKRFPFSLVKIDHSFIADITRSAEDAAIARTVIAMAHQLNMKVIAEGVETLAQLNYLRDHGCDEIQGFYFSPPVSAADFETMLREGRRMELPLPSTPDERTLLLVDDEIALLSSLQRMLRHDGYRILTALSGPDALEQLALNKVQVIVSDQRMPDMSGTQFLEIVKELYPDTVRIILSGYTDLQVVTDSVNRGAVFKFLTKPWDDDLLRDQIRDAFRRHRAAVSH